MLLRDLHPTAEYEPVWSGRAGHYLTLPPQLITVTVRVVPDCRDVPQDVPKRTPAEATDRLVDVVARHPEGILRQALALEAGMTWDVMLKYASLAKDAGRIVNITALCPGWATGYTKRRARYVSPERAREIHAEWSANRDTDAH